MPENETSEDEVDFEETEFNDWVEYLDNED